MRLINVRFLMIYETVNTHINNLSWFLPYSKIFERDKEKPDFIYAWIYTIRRFSSIERSYNDATIAN